MSINTTNVSATHITNMSMTAVISNANATHITNMSMTAVISNANATHASTSASTALHRKRKKKLAVKVDDLAAAESESAQGVL